MQELENYTWRTGSKLGGRLEVPVNGAWQRLFASDKRKEMLEQAFSTQMMYQSRIIAITGPALSGKSMVALAACDLRKHRAVYVTGHSHQPSLKPQKGMCLIVDPVSAFDKEELEKCVNFYKNEIPIILIDRQEENLESLLAKRDTVIRLKMPSVAIIYQYIQQLLKGYNSNLTEKDYQELANTMYGLSFFQINQITLDASLYRMLHSKPIDMQAFSQALNAFSGINPINKNEIQI